MNLERLLAHYDRIADFKDAVPHLRRFVFDVAVRGKLVPQDASAEPALELLKKIEVERKARIENGEIRRKKPLAHTAVEPFEAPDGWLWLTLGDTGNIFLGNSVNTITREKLCKTKNGRPFIATKDVGYGLDPIDYDNGLCVPASDSRFKVARARSVLICAEGGSAGRKIGMTDRDICFGNKLLANETWSVIVPKFVMFVYLSGFFYKQFVAEMTGIISGISINKFLQLPFPLPPLAEQQRIVAKVDQLMTLCARLEAAQVAREGVRARLAAASFARLAAPDSDTFQDDACFVLKALTPLTNRSAQVKALRQIILNLAVQGKLVDQDPADESPLKLLDHARRRLAKQAKSIKRMRWRATQIVSPNEITKSIPQGWIAARLNDTGFYINGMAFKPADWKQSGVPIIRIQNLTDPSKEFNYTDGEFRDEVMVRNGDLLVSWSATLEAFKWERGEGILNQHIFRVIPDEGLTTRDFLLLLLRNAIREMAESDHAHGLVMTHINRGPFLNHIVLIPPLAEQRRIVAKVDVLMTLCDRLEVNLAAVATTRFLLFNTFLSEALNPAAQTRYAAE